MMDLTPVVCTFVVIAGAIAATKACMIAISTLCVGAFLMQPHWAWGWRLVVVILYLMATLPVSSHMLARAAVTEMDPAQQRR